MGKAEGYSASQEPPRDDDVVALNEALGLPCDPAAGSVGLVTRGALAMGETPTRWPR